MPEVDRLGETSGKISERGRRRRRLSFALAAVLTAVMLGWQSVHLYGEYQHAARQESGTCATKLTEAVYIGGQRQMDLLRDLEHGLVVLGAGFDTYAREVWTAEYQQADTQLRAGLGAAKEATSGPLHESIDGVENTYDIVTGDVAATMAHLEAGSIGEATALVTSEPYRSRRAELLSALGEVVVELDEFISKRVENDRRSELISVTGAILLFIAAVGAWIFFLVRLRQSDDLLAYEAATRQEAERELQQSQKMEALGVMAGGVAHDVGNLTSVIAGSATSARAHLDDRAHLDAALERIELAAGDAEQLVSGLMTFAKRAPTDPRPIDVAALVRESEQLVRAAVPADVTVTVSTEEEVWITADPGQLRQAIINLAVNAGEAMPRGGRLDIRVSSAGEDRAEVTVTDTGCGMTPDVADRAFEPFFTAHRDGRGGTGLGLSIVHGIVTEHQGSVAVTSEEGTGTEIRLSFPRIARAPHPQAGATADGSAGSVLMIAPAGYEAELVYEELTRAGNTVTLVDNPLAAAAAWDGAVFDLMVVHHDLDLVLSHRRRPHIPVILMAEEAVPAPADVTVINEPYSLTDLSRLTTSVLFESRSGS